MEKLNLKLSPQAISFLFQAFKKRYTGAMEEEIATEAEKVLEQIKNSDCGLCDRCASARLENGYATNYIKDGQEEFKKYRAKKPYKNLKTHEILEEGHELYHTRPMQFRDKRLLYFPKDEIENNPEIFEIINQKTQDSLKHFLKLINKFPNPKQN